MKSHIRFSDGFGGLPARVWAAGAWRPGELEQRAGFVGNLRRGLAREYLGAESDT